MSYLHPQPRATEKKKKLDFLGLKFAIASSLWLRVTLRHCTCFRQLFFLAQDVLVYILSNILWHFVTPPKCFRDRFLVIIQSGSQSLFKSAIQLAQSLAVATSAEDKTKSVKSKRIDGLTEDKILKMDKLGFPQSNEGMTFVDFTTLICSMVSDIHTVSQDEMKRLFQLFDVDNDGKLSSSESDALNHVIINKVNTLKCALIVVDFQNDFVTGSLAIKKGPAKQDPHDALIPLNRLLKEYTFDLVVYTQDWHPPNHISFYEHCRNGDRSLRAEDKSRKLRPFDVVAFEAPRCFQVGSKSIASKDGFSQVLYPVHCLQNSWGAELCPNLVRVPSAKFVRKGLNVYVEAYSAFSDNNGENKSELAMLLRSEDIEGVFVTGLAYEICVAATTREANNLGFFTALVADCSRGLSAEKIEETNVELSQQNVAIINSKAVESFATSRKIPWRWICQLVGINGNNENDIMVSDGSTQISDTLSMKTRAIDGPGEIKV